MASKDRPALRGWWRSLRARTAAIALASIATVAPQPLLAQQTLSLERALRLAEARSQQLPAQDAAAEAARHLAVAAGRLPDPVLKAGIVNLPADGPDRFSVTRDFMTMRSIGLMQELTSADKRKARSARSEREADVAAAGRLLALSNLQRGTAMAWFELHYIERVVAMVEAQRDEARLQIEAADSAYRAARGPQADVFAARAAVATLDDRLAQLRRDLDTTRTQLARWVGEAAHEPLGPAPDASRSPLDANALDRQLEAHPRLRMLRRQHEVALADAQVAESNRRSDWSVELMYSQRGPAYSNMVSLNVSIPLQWDRSNRQDRELSAKLAAAEQVRAENEEVVREVVAEVRALIQSWNSNRERLQHYERAIVPLSGEQTRAALAAYRGNAGTLDAVLSARRGELDARIEQLRLQMDTARLWAQLAYLIPSAGPRAGMPN